MHSADLLQVTSEQESKYNIPFGYLAVLLVCLSKNERVRARIKKLLPGGHIGQLLGAVEEFLSYHRIIAQKLGHPGDGVDAGPDFTERIQAQVNFVKAAEVSN